VPGALFFEQRDVAEASQVVTLRRDPSLTTLRSNLVSRERRRRIDIKRADNHFSSQRARTRLEQRGALAFAAVILIALVIAGCGLF
jgi:hypothetical protein